MRVARSRALTGLVVALAAVVGTACSSGDSSARPKPTPTTKSVIGGGLGTTVVFAHPSPYGTILTAALPATLYVNVNDSRGHNTCTGQCARTWLPLVTRGQPQAGDGANASLVGSFRRNDGRRQVTYNGHPLYTYRRDHQPLEATGQGAGGDWYVISASGDPVMGKPQ
jgi:predicted lipoprotein with Yx(FWY)xxD motif